MKEAVQHTTTLPETAKPAMDEAVKEKDMSQEKAKLTVQPKLSVGAPNDPYEKEADSMADKVMRMPGENFVQRKCADCEKEEKVQRKPLAASVASFIQTKSEVATPPVSDTLSQSIQSSRGGGSAMDGNTQSFMSQRFGTDFSDVKIHTGGDAIQMSAELNAKAFTVGNDVYFNQGEYQPYSDSGKHLLAHELTHTIQQGADIDRKIQRSPGDDFIEVDIMTVDPSESEALRQQNITLPPGGIVWSLPSPALVARIRQVLIQNGQTPSPLNPTPISNPTFVLHDTASSMGARAIANHARDDRGPLGGGAAAYVPDSGSATVTRPSFFDRRRPTATEFEKGSDIMRQQARLDNIRTIWQNSSSTAQTAALSTALAGLSLTPAEVTAQTTAATTELNARIGSTGLVFSTGTWAVNELCNQITASGIASVVNNAANTATLQAAYNVMNPLFATRNQRLGSTVNVEIVQSAGSDCRPNGTPLTPYSATVYTNTSMLYLQAVLQAGRFPQITTHFLVDKTAGNHCDPRCFDLGLLYVTLGGWLTFGNNVSFGITPQYGTRAADNVWWSDPVCGGVHP